jgi:hypothetical protein
VKVRSDDVWIHTFPRSGKWCKWKRKFKKSKIIFGVLQGTTWTSELTWLIMNDCNFEEAARVGLPIRSPNLGCFKQNSIYLFIFYFF